jgi:hypothetical protein
MQACFLFQTVFLEITLSVLLSKDGVTPVVLFTSGSFDGNNPDEHMTTHTYAHAFAGKNGSAMLKGN